MHDSASTNPKDRVGRNKPPLDLIPPSAEILEGAVMRLGARKYGPYNWRRQKVRASVYIAAARRHLAQWLDGEDLDAESQVSHLAHARACLGILIDAIATDCVMDDRPPGGAATELIGRLTWADSSGVDTQPPTGKGMPVSDRHPLETPSLADGTTAAGHESTAPAGDRGRCSLCGPVRSGGA